MTTPRRDTSSSHQPPAADAGAKVLLAGDPGQLAAVDAGGAFGPISDEPHRLVTLAGYLPARPVIDATTQALQCSAGRDLFCGHDQVVLACCLVGGLAAARLLFRWQPTRRARRPGRPADARCREPG